MVSTTPRSTPGSTPDVPDPSEPDTGPAEVTGDRAGPQPPGRIAPTLQRRCGVALRAGVGAAVLLGVAAAVDGLGDLGAAPLPASAAALCSGPVPPATAPGAGSTGASSALALDDTKALLAGRTRDMAREIARSQARQFAAKAYVDHLAAQANARARQQADAAAARQRQAEQRAAAAAAAQQRQAEQRAAAAAAARQRQTEQRAAAAVATRQHQDAEASRGTWADPRSAARALLAARGWSGQFGCLDALWQRESGWNPSAYNPSSGAFGIPQALPGGKMAAAGADWRTNPVTQIRWGLDYIAARYGTPCGAWGHSQAYGWY